MGSYYKRTSTSKLRCWKCIHEVSTYPGSAVGGVSIKTAGDPITSVGDANVRLARARIPAAITVVNLMIIREMRRFLGQSCAAVGSLTSLRERSCWRREQLDPLRSKMQ